MKLQVKAIYSSRITYFSSREIQRSLITQLSSACTQLLHYFSVSEACFRGLKLPLPDRSHARDSFYFLGGIDFDAARNLKPSVDLNLTSSPLKCPSTNVSHEVSNIDGFIDDSYYTSDPAVRIDEEEGTGPTSLPSLSSLVNKMDEQQQQLNTHTAIADEPIFTDKHPPVTFAEDPPVTLAEDPSATLAEDAPVTLAGDPPVTLAGDPPVTLAGDPPVTLAGDPPGTLAEDPPVTLAGKDDCDKQDQEVRDQLSRAYPHLMACLGGQSTFQKVEDLAKDVQKLVISLEASAGMLKVLYHGSLKVSVQETEERPSASHGVSSEATSDADGTCSEMTVLRPVNAQKLDVEEEAMSAEVDEVKSDNHRLQGICSGLQEEKKKLQQDLESLEKYSAFVAQELRVSLKLLILFWQL